MLLNEKQRELVFLRELSAEEAKCGVQRVTDLQRLPVDPFNRPQPQLQRRTEDAFRLLKERIEEQFLWRVLQAEPSLRAAHPRITGPGRSKLQAQAGEPVSLQNCTLKIGARDIHRVDAVGKYAMQLGSRIEDAKRPIVHHNDPQCARSGTMHQMGQIVSRGKAANSSQKDPLRFF